MNKLCAMLYADKQALETDLKVSLLAIRDRELNFYVQNLRSIATQAGVMSGFAYATVTSATGMAHHGDWQAVLFLLVTTIAMDLNIFALGAATWCGMLGPGLALRGPDGAMDKAVEGLALEYRNIFLAFALGITFFLFSAVVFVFEETGEGGSFDWLQSVLMFLIFFVTIRAAVKSCKRIYKKFRIRAEHAVSGNFHFNAPRQTREQAELARLSARKRWWQWPRRQYLHWRVFYDEFLGISSSVYTQRYLTAGATGERAYDFSISAIIRQLELPNTFEARGGDGRRLSGGRARVSSGDGASSSAAAAASSSSMGALQGDGFAPPAPSGPPQGNFSRLFRRRAPGDTAGLIASTDQNLELAAMQPSAQFGQGGTISPADSDTSGGSNGGGTTYRFT